MAKRIRQQGLTYEMLPPLRSTLLSFVFSITVSDGTWEVSDRRRKRLTH